MFLRTDGCIRLAKSGLSSSDFRVFLALAGVIDKDNYFCLQERRMYLKTFMK